MNVGDAIKNTISQYVRNSLSSIDSSDISNATYTRTYIYAQNNAFTCLCKLQAKLGQINRYCSSI